MLRTRPKPSSDAQDQGEQAARDIGRRLREARLARGEEVREVADHLRIRPAYVAALEEGEFGRIPGRPYVVGFLRSYGAHLGLDGEELVGKLKASAAGRAAARPELSVREPIAESRRGTAAMVTASLLLAAAVYTGYYVIYHVDRGGAGPTVTEAPGEVARLATDTLRRGDAARVERSAAAAAAPPPAAPPAPADRSIASLSASEDGAPAAAPPPATAAAAPSPAPTEANAAPASARELLAALESDRVGGPRPSAANAGDPSGRLALVAAEAAWIQVRSAGRDYVRTRTLQPGERFTLPNRSDLALWTGDAGALEVLVDGQSRGRLGRPGEAARSLPLGVDQLKARPPVAR